MKVCWQEDYSSDDRDELTDVPMEKSVSFKDKLMGQWGRKANVDMINEEDDFILDDGDL